MSPRIPRDTCWSSPRAWTSRAGVPSDIPGDVRAEVLRRYPRLGLAEEFVACFRDQAERKPDSLAAKLVGRGFAARVAANPLDR